jgi:hypothetical protein
VPADRKITFLASDDLGEEGQTSLTLADDRTPTLTMTLAANPAKFVVMCLIELAKESSGLASASSAGTNLGLPLQAACSSFERTSQRDSQSHYWWKKTDFHPYVNSISPDPHRKRLDSAVLTADRIDQAAWSECAAASAATFQGSSSSMRLIG